jgi:opacity protein-like surface antigen
MKLNAIATTLALLGPTLGLHAGTDMMMNPHPREDTKDMKQMDNRVSDAGFYVAVLGGAQFSTDYGNNRQTASGTGLFGASGTNQTIHSNWGGVGGLKAGYKFESFPICDWMQLRLQPAVEAEALYIGDDSHASDLAGGGSFEHFTSNSGDFFINGILRFKNSSPVTPYIGAGPGLQYITTHGYINVPAAGLTATGLDTSDLDFAGQALFGLEYAVAPHFSIFTEYKFIDALGTDGKSTNAPTALGSGATYRFKPDQIEQHLITAGIKYNF